MVNMNFIGTEYPRHKEDASAGEGAVDINPSQLVDIAFKVYNSLGGAKTKEDCLRQQRSPGPGFSSVKKMIS